MAFVSKITYPGQDPKATGAAGRVQVVATPDEAARRSTLSILLYDAGGALCDWMCLADLPAVTDPGSGQVIFDWAVALDDPDLGLRAVAFFDVTGAPPVRSFVCPGAAVVARDGPAAGSAATPVALSGANDIRFDSPADPPKGAAPSEAEAEVTGLGAGTLIETPDGDRRIEDLSAGDLVTTWDGGAAPLRLVLSCDLPADDPYSLRRSWPVRIGAGALGFGLPRDDLWVGPHHRMLYQSIKVPLLFGEDAVFVRAKSMAASFDRIHVDGDRPVLTYHHLIFDRPEVIFAQGVATESTLPDPRTLERLSPALQARLDEFLSDLDEDARADESGWPTLRSWELMACVA